MHSLIEDLTWRYATKRYDSNQKVSKEQIDIIKTALQLVPTSYGLQPSKFIFVEKSQLREDLFNHSFNQKAIIEASHLLIICSYIDVQDDLIDSYMANTSKSREISLDKLTGFGNFIKEQIGKLSLEQKSSWNSKQAYIALGVLMQTCAQLRIDSTPMEGFLVSEYDKILGLKEKNLTSTLVVPIGFRHEEDANQHLKKVRRGIDELFEEM